MTLALWAFWGVLGAFGYAAPRLATALFDQAKIQVGRSKSIAEFVIAVATGPIASAGIGPLLSIDMHRTSEAECRALALFVGLLVNPVAPAAVELMTNLVLARLGHPLAKRTTKP